MSLTQNIVTGIETGSFIAVSAIGITLVYGLIDMINFSHAEYMAIGAYVGIIVVNVLGLPLIAALILVPLVTAIAGWAIARIFFMPLREAGPIPLLVTSIGVGLILKFGIDIVAGSTPMYLQASIVNESISFAGINIANYTFIVVGIAIASFVMLHLMLTRTEIGIALRAMSANENLALVTGINTNLLRHFVWLVSSAMAGLSGFLLIFPLYAFPNLGFSQILIVITAAILGGAGSVYGAIVGSYLLGLTIEISTGTLLPGWGSNLGLAVAFVVLILVLFVRPGGIAGSDVEKLGGTK